MGLFKGVGDLFFAFMIITAIELVLIGYSLSSKSEKYTGYGSSAKYGKGITGGFRGLGAKKGGNNYGNSSYSKYSGNGNGNRNSNPNSNSNSGWTY